MRRQLRSRIDREGDHPWLPRSHPGRLLSAMSRRPWCTYELQLQAGAAAEIWQACDRCRQYKTLTCYLARRALCASSRKLAGSQCARQSERQLSWCCRPIAATRVSMTNVCYAALTGCMLTFKLAGCVERGFCNNPDEAHPAPGKLSRLLGNRH